MEVVNGGAIVQGETMLCIPLGDDQLSYTRSKKRHRRLLVSDSMVESHSNNGIPSKRPPGLAASRRSSTSFARSLDRELSLDSSVDSSGQPEVSDDSTASPIWEFQTVASFSCESPSPFSSDVISTIDYDESGQLVATGGLARKIRICSYHQLELISQTSTDQQQVKNLFTTICMPAKLSSLRWRPGSSQVIACGDYDGSVTEWDVEHGVTVSERYEHAGRTVWSIDYSRDSHSLLASASSDSTVRFWSRGVEGSVGLIKSFKRNSMCCVEFNKVKPSLLAVACTDASVHLYDMRKLEVAVMSLRGHQRSVSYVRWLGEHSLVSSSPDGTVKLWDVNVPNQTHELTRSFDAHTNSRNFVGLSVTDSAGSGLIATGSESNEVFVYSPSKETPVFRHRFPSRSEDDDTKAFVGSVCWTKQEEGYSLISANSQGVVQVTQALQA